MVESRIALEKGICGIAASQLKTIRVDNIHKFEGHVAGDNASFSEIVIPFFYPNKKHVFENLIGVLDISSPVFARFSEVDQKCLEKITDLISEKVVWPSFSQII